MTHDEFLKLKADEYKQMKADASRVQELNENGQRTREVILERHQKFADFVNGSADRLVGMVKSPLENQGREAMFVYEVMTQETKSKSDEPTRLYTDEEVCKMIREGKALHVSLKGRIFKEAVG